MVVFAGAGSGKTRVITHRVCRLVLDQGVSAYRIVCVTFTNKAASEMRERLHTLMGDAAESLWVGTFHATCARILRRFHEEVGVRKTFTIYDDGDQVALITRILRDLGLRKGKSDAKEIARAISRAKQEVIGPQQFEVERPADELVALIYPKYQDALDRAGALDFSDLIYRLVVALESTAALRAELQARFHHVLVDEFQDTNHVQFRLLRALCPADGNLFVVGDDDQSIYRWRGADRRNILDFRRWFQDAQVVKLEENYRSTKRILRVAHAVIERNLDREPKTLWTQNEEGDPVTLWHCEDERDEAHRIVRVLQEHLDEGCSLAEIAIFYRIHAQSRVIEEALRAADLPYRIVGGTRFYDRAEVKDLLAYLRSIHNPDDDVSLLRIINTPSRGIGKTTLDRLLNRAAERGEGVYHTLQKLDSEPSEIQPAAAKRLQKFAKLLASFRQGIEDGISISALGRRVVEETGYREALQKQDTPEADARLQNVEELLGSLTEFEQEAEEPSLGAFLELVTLQTSADLQESGERVTLMTVHAAKGLEFPSVLIAGLEEKLFPLRIGDELYLEDREELEEERRLAYVAFTRAKARLHLFYGSVRRIFGKLNVAQPSRFLSEIPTSDVMTMASMPRRNISRSSKEHRISGYGTRSVDKSPSARMTKESYVDTTEGFDFESGSFCTGMRVRHRKFGVGLVRDVLEGIPPRVSVDFPGWGVKRIATAFLEPH